MKDVQQINWPMLPTLSPKTAAAVVQPLRWLVGAADWALTMPMHRRKRLSDSQIWLITEKEITTNIQNLKSPAAFLLMAILILISFFLMSADYQKRLDNWSNNQVAQKDKLFSGITSSYRSTESMMMNAKGIPREPMLRRPLPLSIFAKGLDSVMERSVTIGDNPVVPVATSFTLGTTQERNRNLLLFAPPDYLYIIKIILSLLAMFFTYDTLVGERESGTLKAMLSGAVRRRTILVGKWFGASISIIVPFLFATGIGFAYLVAVKHFTFDQSDVYRILLALASSCLYILVFIGLGLFISAVTSTQKVAIAAALSVWVTLVLVIPNLSVLIAERSKPLPSIFQHNARVFARPAKSKTRQIANSTAKMSIQGTEPLMILRNHGYDRSSHKPMMILLRTD